MSTTTKPAHRTSGVMIALAAVALLLAALAAQPAQAAVKHYDGTVTAKSHGPKKFTIRTESGPERTFRVNAGTEFERIAGGFGGLDRGLAVEVDAVKRGGRLLARQVESSGGGHGGGHGGNDDPPGHHR